ncbi:MAG: peptide deformylase [Enterococcus sp.]
MHLPIIVHPDELLRKKNEPVEEITDELVAFLDDLYETMLAHDGVGIAAPQVGKNIRVALVEVEENDLFELINPEIIQKSGSEIAVEGCLSFPHLYGTVERAESITVRYFDRDGEGMEVVASGFLARALQHEIDHLDGILFTDKLLEKIPEEKLDEYMEAHGHD